MFCRECGKMIQEASKFCTGCGTKVQPIAIKSNVASINNSPDIIYKNQVENNLKTNTNVLKLNDKYSVGFNILSFFAPIVGLILFLVMREDTPKKAKGIGISALIGYIISNIVSLLYIVFMVWLTLSQPEPLYEKPHMDYEYNDNYDFDYNYNEKFKGKYNI